MNSMNEFPALDYTAFTTRHGFLAIRNIRQVEDLLRAALLPSE